MKTNVDVIKEKVESIIVNVKGVKEEMDEASEWNSLGDILRNIGALSTMVMDVVLVVEVVSTDAIDDLEDLKSSDKLDAAVKVLDDIIDLPIYLEFIDGPAFRLLISLVVNFLNEKFGEDWNLDVAREAIDTGVSLITKINTVVSTVTD